MQRTLNRESKELEVAGREAIATCVERRSGRGSLHLWGYNGGGSGATRTSPALTSVRSSNRYQLEGYDASLVFGCHRHPSNGVEQDGEHALGVGCVVSLTEVIRCTFSQPPSGEVKEKGREAMYACALGEGGVVAVLG